MSSRETLGLRLLQSVREMKSGQFARITNIEASDVVVARRTTDMQSPVMIDPDIMSGVPVFRGTRVPVRTLFEHLETGETLDEFLEGFPSVSREQVIAFFELISARIADFATASTK